MMRLVCQISLDAESGKGIWLFTYALEGTSSIAAVILIQDRFLIRKYFVSITEC